jgi:formate dehydrogenase subunit gamma
MTTADRPLAAPAAHAVRTERTFLRFTLGQRWEHALLILSFTVLLLTGLPQKYRAASWSLAILTTPERLTLLRTIHRVAAVVLIAEVVFHVGSALVGMAKRRLSSAMFPTWQDIKDAGQMIRYLLFLSDRKPVFAKYSFEQKFTYWFFFFGIGIMVITGLVLWFPILFTRIFPGGMVPAAKLAHSTEAVVAGIFLLIWHVYHVHIERLNLSMFTGWLNDRDMRQHHPLEYKRLTGESAEPPSGEETK